ncbi:HlyD family efflux transporter periplasmic adaptor subunit [Cyanobacterium stanieri LEGE 03274]|uniref:HlyD family efflux transporter periplasmic adaptor subunit n=1 Tax=Cyanobacterium stanieri LEGE 03274 TaxID=1828756 RepID=A0ABR9V5N3_9CHRO|nr:HlyD family efflux transporter periplasmic adaptor subunit [Cyanobacterium stanieri]MBE9223203.1 HlyD family efflux transporter periplasmic adaptor subunit [Cyanobacterium stanieri LEGE 03274]
MSDRTSVFADNGKKWIILSAILGVITLGGSAIYVMQRTNSQTQGQESTPPPTATIEAVSALGRIEPEGEVITVAASPSMAGAKVRTLLVSQGDFVGRGEVIATTTDYDTKQAELERARKDLEVARANLAIVRAGAKEGEINAQKATIERLQAQIATQREVDNARISRLRAQITSERVERQATVERLEAELNNAQNELRRYQDLVRDGVVSQSEFETRELTFQAAQKRFQESEATYQKTVDTLNAQISELEAVATQNIRTLTQQINEAQARLEEIREVRGVDVAASEAEVNRALAGVNQAEIELELTQIKAPINGQIIEIKAREGENIDNAQGVVEMANTEQMLVVAEVYETDITRVKLGQEATIESENNTFTDTIRGNVVEISSKIGKKDVLETDPAASIDARVVEVKIAVNPEYNDIINGLIYSQVFVQILL